MLCENCGINNATTHIHSIVNGVVHEKYLCTKCALKDSNDTSNDFTKILSSMFDDTMSATGKIKVARCACCGSTFNDIAKNGKCGCSECYSTFYEQLLPYFKRVHGSTKHIGKMPECAVINQNKTQTIDELREKIKQFVAEEKYEEAAVIRDKIKSMESEL